MGNPTDAVVAGLFRTEAEDFGDRIAWPVSRNGLRSGTFQPDTRGKRSDFPLVPGCGNRREAYDEFLTGGGRNLLRCHRCATCARNQEYHLW